MLQLPGVEPLFSNANAGRHGRFDERWAGISVEELRRVQNGRCSAGVQFHCLAMKSVSAGTWFRNI